MLRLKDEIEGTITNSRYLKPITLNESTIGTTEGTFAFAGSDAPWQGQDWVGLQIGSNVDRAQLRISGGLFWRSNDNAQSAVTNDNWTEWYSALATTGGIMIGTINSTVNTNSYIAGSQGTSIINTSLSKPSYVALWRIQSTNGVFTIAKHTNAMKVVYMNDSTVSAGTNTITWQSTLLDESGNASFPNTVTAKIFSGNATSANKLTTARKISLTGNYLSGSANFDGSGDANITATAVVPINGKQWQGLGVIRNDGVMEVGRFIDFHHTNTSNNDFDCRLQTNASNGQTQNTVNLPNASGTLALTTDNVSSASRLRSLQSNNPANQNTTIKIGSFTMTSQADVLILDIYGGNGQNGHSYQNTTIRIFIKKGYQLTASASGAFGTTVEEFGNNVNCKVYVMASSATAADVYIQFPYGYPKFSYTYYCGGSTEYSHACTDIGTSAPTSGTANEVQYILSVPHSRTIAGIDLKDNITAAELDTALPAGVYRLTDLVGAGDGAQYVGETITLSDSINNYDFIVVATGAIDPRFLCRRL